MLAAGARAERQQEQVVLAAAGHKPEEPGPQAEAKQNQDHREPRGQGLAEQEEEKRNPRAEQEEARQTIQVPAGRGQSRTLGQESTKGMKVRGLSKQD